MLDILMLHVHSQHILYSKHDVIQTKNILASDAMHLYVYAHSNTLSIRHPVYTYQLLFHNLDSP